MLPAVAVAIAMIVGTMPAAAELFVYPQKTLAARRRGSGGTRGLHVLCAIR